MQETQSEQQFLDSYDASKYPRPSVTADIIIFTRNDNGRLAVLLIRRNGHPYKDCWAIPGGFLAAGQESAEQTAARELKEETNLTGIPLRQLATFSHPDRDPRTHVISVAYTALVPKHRLCFQAGDDAGDARLFDVSLCRNTLRLSYNGFALDESQIAFDHAHILKTAIERLRGRIDYEPDAFELLNDPYGFTIHELKCIFESIKETELDTPNFRKMFFRNYVKKGFSVATGRKKKEGRAPEAMLYTITKGGTDHV